MSEEQTRATEVEENGEDYEVPVEIELLERHKDTDISELRAQLTKAREQLQSVEEEIGRGDKIIRSAVKQDEGALLSDDPNPELPSVDAAEKRLTSLGFKVWALSRRINELGFVISVREQQEYEEKAEEVAGRLRKVEEEADKINSELEQLRGELQSYSSEGRYTRQQVGRYRDAYLAANEPPSLRDIRNLVTGPTLAERAKSLLSGPSS